MSDGGRSDQRRRSIAGMSLPELLRYVRDDLGVSGRRMAADAGFDGLRSTISALIDGTHSGEVKAETLARIARALQPHGIDDKTVYAAALRAAPPSPFRLPPEADYLSPRQRAAILNVIGAMLEDRPGVKSSVRSIHTAKGSGKSDGLSEGLGRLPAAARSGRRETQDPEQP